MINLRLLPGLVTLFLTTSVCERVRADPAAMLPVSPGLAAALTVPNFPAVILTPPPPHTPRINGPRVFGVRPGSPFLYSIPATGDRPMQFAVAGLPKGLTVDTTTGRISGALKRPGSYRVTLQAKNDLGIAQVSLKIIVGDTIALTPPMGWNSWNCWHGSVNQDNVLQAAQGMIASNLQEHGWSYINIDDTWQGRRGGKFNGIQPDNKFPDIQGLSDQIHGMGLKFGIYSTPWTVSYAGHIGGSSTDPQGEWDPKANHNGTPDKNILPDAIGPYTFYTQDATQYAAWGVDFLKFDWAPIEVPETQEMEDALRSTGRDIVLSLSNNFDGAVFPHIDQLSPIANSWRISGDIIDTWRSVESHGFGNDQWAPYERPGHWNDPDMLEVGTNGGGTPKRLTPDEQYTHISMWCLLSAPLLLGCDLQHLDAFTLGLITNDEVLAIDQDELGKQATAVSTDGQSVVYAKPLADGSWAAGLFNVGDVPAAVHLKWSDIGIHGPQQVRDLWRQQNLGVFDSSFRATVAPHGVVMIRVIASK